MRQLIAGNLIGMAAALLGSSASVADEPKGPVTLAVVGTPKPNIVIGDARHCPVQPAPVGKPSGDRVEFSLLAGQPVSITLSARRGGDICGGSLYMVPEAGWDYIAHLTPGSLCAAELYRVNPQAETTVQLWGADYHADLNGVMCAAQQDPPGTSRLAVGRNVRRYKMRVESGTGGDCGKFDHVPPGKSGIELAAEVPQWVRLLSCDVSIKFTPSAGTSYMIDTEDYPQQCEVRLEKSDARGELSMIPYEHAGNTNCKSAH